MSCQSINRQLTDRQPDKHTQTYGRTEELIDSQADRHRQTERKKIVSDIDIDNEYII